MSNMKYVWLMLITSIFSLGQIAQAADANELNLDVGDQHVYVHAKPVKRVAVGSPEIVSINILTSRNIMITGKQAGVTEILIWESEKAAAPAKQIKVSVSVSTALEKQRLQFSKAITLHPAGNQ